MEQKLSLTLFGLFLVGFMLTVTPARAGMSDLGTLGGNHSEAHAINSGGQIAGYSQTAGGHIHAFLYSSGKMVDLGTIGGLSSYAFGINNSGQVVGHSYLAATQTSPPDPRRPGQQGQTTYPIDGAQHAFLYTNGKMNDIGTLGGTTSAARAINNIGQIVGWSQTADGQQHVFLYANGNMTDLGINGGMPYAINDGGQIVGSYLVGNLKHAFSYANGKMTDLGTLGGSNSEAIAVNNSGQIIGWSQTSTGQAHAFLYGNGKMTDLGTLGGATSYAFCINGPGQIVGASYLAGGGSHAFAYANGKMRDIGTLGGHWSQAFGINTRGEIVGYADTAANQQHGFVYFDGTPLVNHDKNVPKLPITGLTKKVQ